jgi:poly(ADP-ribose) glycohydrolase ARH3
VPATRDHFRGCLLGQAVGDALGAPYEGLNADNLYWGWGPPAELVRNPSGETLRYTDDTQMMIGVAETLAEHGTIAEEPLCAAFVRHYDPERCYGQGARRVLEAMAAGGDWRGLARDLFPGGSLGNGAAMRAAPVGLLFCDDLDRVAEEARRQALPTHLHPLGVEGAQLFAVAVALAVRADPFDRKEFFRTLRRRARGEEFRWALAAASRLNPGSSLGFLGNSLEAHRSVVTAIACFALAPGDYELAVGRALGQGNDTDTLAAMAGALSGAHLGVAAVPARLREQLEDGPAGRGHLETLADRLFGRYESGRRPTAPREG